MNHTVSRRQFLQASAIAGAGLALPKNLLAAGKKSVLIFTKSSGFEHDVIKVTPGHPSILEQAVRTLGAQHGFEVTATKDGSVFTAYVKDSPILDADGRLIGIVGCSIEIADPDLAQAVRSLISDNNHGLPGRRTRTLSPREREVLALLARGLTGEQIAERLVLSPETVRTHIRNAREKLGASTRVEAVTMALLAREIQI